MGHCWRPVTSTSLGTRAEPIWTFWYMFKNSLRSSQTEDALKCISIRYNSSWTEWWRVKITPTTELSDVKKRIQERIVNTEKDRAHLKCVKSDFALELVSISMAVSGSFSHVSYFQQCSEGRVWKSNTTGFTFSKKCLHWLLGILSLRRFRCQKNAEYL